MQGLASRKNHWKPRNPRRVCGLFMIAEIRAVEADTEEFEEALYRRVHHRATSMM
jgi:hypothetical protein